MSEGGSMTIQVETIKTWMVRYYKGEERAVLFDDHLAALAERDARIEYLESAFKEKVRDFKDEMDRHHQTGLMVEKLSKQIAALQDEINNPKKTYCAWCGFTVEIDDDAGSGIAKHVDTCEKHPLNRKIAALDLLISQNDIVLSGYEATLKQADKQIAALTAKYNELIMAVSCKWPHETRHETALRYIQEKDRGGDNIAKAALRKEDTNA